MIDLQKSSNFEKNIENICTYYVKVHKKGHFLKKYLHLQSKGGIIRSLSCVWTQSDPFLEYMKEVQLNGKM